MTPNAPLTVGNYPKFSEGSNLASSRDSRNVSQSWKHTRANTSQLSALQKTVSSIQDNLNRLRRNRPGGYIPTAPATQGQVAVPFAVYQPQVSSGSCTVVSPGTGYVSGQTYALLGGEIAPGGSATQIMAITVGATGNLLSAVVVSSGQYTTPPTYPANLTGGATVWVLSQSADGWRTFGIRAGCVGARSTYAPWDGTNYSAVSWTAEQHFWGNSEWVFALSTDANIGSGFEYAGDSPYPNYLQVVYPGTAVSLNFNNDVLVYGYLPDGPGGSAGTFVNYETIVLDPTGTVEYPSGVLPGDYEPGAAVFWIEVVDDPTTLKGFYCNVWGRMQPGLFSGNLEVPNFQQGPNIITIAYVSAYFTGQGVDYKYIPQGTSCIQQIQVGNAVNRYPSMNIPHVNESINIVTGIPMVWRGAWSDVSGQFFYPGDVVSSDSGYGTMYVASSSGGSPTRKMVVNTLWQYTGAPFSGAGSGPPDLATGWQEVGSDVTFPP